MSPPTIMELTQVVAQRYLKAKSRKEKTHILNEYCANTGFNRKYAITKIRKTCFSDQKSGKRGRKKIYSNAADVALIEIWKSFDGICGERLHPFLPEAIAILQRHNRLTISNSVKQELLKISCATVKRRIRRHKKLHERTLACTTKPGYLLKRNIPIQTASWNTNKAGFLEIDLVAHCGGSLNGDFLYTLQAVDINTTWTERRAVMGKGQGRVFTAIQHIENKLPFPLLGIDSDNGSEFINHQLWRYCKKEGIAFTRSRPYMKKDNAHIEQKNYTLVRKILGYERFDTDRHLQLVNDLYDNELRLFLNFFQPTLKLKSKDRVGAKIKRKYEKSKTPYQRVMESPEVDKETKAKLKTLYESLDPIELKKKIDEKISLIIALPKKSGV